MWLVLSIVFPSGSLLNHFGLKGDVDLEVNTQDFSLRPRGAEYP